MTGRTASPAARFGRILRAGRHEAKLTQEELAAQLRIGQTTLSSYERGESEPPLGTAVLISEITGIPIEDLAAPFSSRRRLERAS